MAQIRVNPAAKSCGTCLFRYNPHLEYVNLVIEERDGKPYSTELGMELKPGKTCLYHGKTVKASDPDCGAYFFDGIAPF